MQALPVSVPQLTQTRLQPAAAGSAGGSLNLSDGVDDG